MSNRDRNDHPPTPLGRHEPCRPVTLPKRRQPLIRQLMTTSRLVATFALAATLATACSGDSEDSKDAKDSKGSGLLAFAQCMRDNGITDFPTRARTESASTASASSRIRRSSGLPRRRVKT